MRFVLESCLCSECSAITGSVMRYIKCWKLVKVKLGGGVGGRGRVVLLYLPSSLALHVAITLGMISNVNHYWGRFSGGGQESVDTGQMVAVGPILVLFIK